MAPYRGGQRSAVQSRAQREGVGSRVLDFLSRTLVQPVRAAVDPVGAYNQEWERQNQVLASQRSLLDRVPPPGAFTPFPDTAGTYAPGPAPAPSPILTPADSFKPAPFTQEGQFGRYFKTPEFDYVFGGGARGKGAPATAAAMEQLAAQEKAPMDSPLSSYYAAQSAMGQVNQPQIQEMYKDRPDLQKWAAANPMLAQREYAKKYGTTDITNLAPDQETVIRDLGSGAQAEGGYTLEGFGIRDKVDKFLGKK